MSVILFLASLFPAPFSRNQMMNEKVQERTRRGEERRTFLFFLLHPDRSPIPRFGGMSDLTREERGITGSPAFAWLATQRQPLQSPQFQPRVNDSRLLIIEFSQMPYRAVSELQGRLVVRSSATSATCASPATRSSSPESTRTTTRAPSTPSTVTRRLSLHRKVS